MVLGIFKIALCWRDRHVFMWQSMEILSSFNILTLKQILWKTKTFLKNWSTVFYLKAQRLKMHHLHAKLPYQANVKTYRIVCTKWTYHKEKSFASNFILPITLFFWKFCFSLRASCKELIWCTNNPNDHIPIFSKCWSFIWWCSFPVTICKFCLKFNVKGLSWNIE